MLITNQSIEYSFALKDTIRIDGFKYKSGEVDGDGIEVSLKDITLPENAFIMVNWLHETNEQYLYVPTSATTIQENVISIRPPRTVLISDHISFEIVVSDGDKWMLKGPTITIPVVPSLIDEEMSADEDEGNITLELIKQNEAMRAVATNTISMLSETFSTMNDDQTIRATAEQKRVADYNAEISASASATSNANAKKALADTAKNAAQAAADSANSVATATQTASTTITTNSTAITTRANEIKAQAKTLSDRVPAINTAEANATSKANTANTAATNANTARDRANAAKTDVDNSASDVATCRTDITGAVNASVDERLDKEYGMIEEKLQVMEEFSGWNGFSADDSFAGDVRELKVKGQTLVNIASGGYHTYPYETTGSAQTFNSNIHMMKTNTTYTFFCDYEIVNTYPGMSVFIYRYRHSGGYTNLSSDGTDLGNGRKTTLVKFTSNAAAPQDFQRCYIRNPDGVGKIILHGAILLEGDHTDKPIEFFEGLESVEVGNMKSFGENLLDKTVLYPGLGSSTAGTLHTFNADDSITLNSWSNSHVGPYWLVKTKPGASYHLGLSSDRGVTAKIYDAKTGSTLYAKSPATIPLSFIALGEFTRVHLVTNGTSGGAKIWNLRITESSLKTYTPYKENSFTLPEPITLRSVPNGVADEIDFEKGVLIRRCGEVVLNGSEEWSLEWAPNLITTIRFMNLGDYSGRAELINCVNDRLPSLSFNQRDTDVESVYSDFIGGRNRLDYHLLKSKLTTPDVAGFKAWLQANPTTVVYELATPTIEQLTPQQLMSYASQTNITLPSVIPAMVSAKVPVSYLSTLTRVMKSSSISKSVQESLLKELSSASAERKEEDIALARSNWEMDDRVYELEWAMSGDAVKLSSKTLSQSKFEQAKKLILANAYDRTTMQSQLEKYVTRDIITQEELEILIAMMDANELTK